ncbi:hypothetical protein DAI22_11g112650 [Oryza sativa Japonica Group]|jgi:hypothetical protein|nr:hypothetical protein DAI22_11g112650 [Oryza sativa Japonica Group]
MLAVWWLKEGVYMILSVCIAVPVSLDRGEGGADPFEKVMVLVKKMMAAVGSPHSRAAEDMLMQASSQCGEEELERSNMTLLRCWSRPKKLAC